MADWQFTKWGDSLDKVLTYKPQDIRKTTLKETEDKSIETIGQTLATGPYQARDLKTQAYYLFSKSGLSGVQLSFSSSDDSLKALEMMKSQYGKPNSAIDQMPRDCKDIRYEWTDAEAQNFIRYNFYKCVSGYFSSSVIYSPVLKRSETGL